MEEIKNFIFDLDGTIIDTIDCITSSINLSMEHFSYPYRYTKEEVKHFIGFGAREFLRRAFNDNNLSEEFIDHFFEFYIPLQQKLHFESAEAFKGLKEVLKELKDNDKKLFVVTNKPAPVAIPLVKKIFGDDFFIDVIGVDKTVIPKPDPYMVNIIMNKYNLKASESVYVGDSITDLRTAQNTSMRSIITLYGYGLYDEFPLDEATYLIKDVNEFKQFIK